MLSSTWSHKIILPKGHKPLIQQQQSGGRKQSSKIVGYLYLIFFTIKFQLITEFVIVFKEIYELLS